MMRHLDLWYAISGVLILMLTTTRTGAPSGPRVVTVASSSPLIHIKVMIRAGSAMDPPGMEGLAYLTARMMIEGGFGDPEHPITKERLAEQTQPWGSGAYPTVQVERETTTFSMTVPADRFRAYLRSVVRPMFTRPLFLAEELDRLRNETLQQLRTLRFEQIELVGLVALDAYIHEGTSYAHPPIGTENGLRSVTVEAVRRFYRTYYQPHRMVVGVSRDDPATVRALRSALADTGQITAEPLSVREPQPPPPVQHRSVVIIALPNAIATGIHAGFPIPITRSHADYWPLYVATLWFGAHRDSFSHLYQVIREERGYNYGDYAYIEHFEGRPFHLFPPTNTPRRYQYFSIWIRPVDHRYALHILKALTWELEYFIRTGLTDEQCALAKNKARVLYLSLAETTDRWVGYRLDDRFYGLDPGYLDVYLEKIDAVTCAEVNRVIRQYLQTAHLKYVIVTDDAVAPELARAIAEDRPAWGKRPEDYPIEVTTQDGEKVYHIPAHRLSILQRDAVWAHTWLNIPPDRIFIVPADALFRTAVLPKRSAIP